MQSIYYRRYKYKDDGEQEKVSNKKKSQNASEKIKILYRFVRHDLE